MLLLATHAMGTRFELVLHGADEGELRAVGEEAIRVIEEWHARLSRFEPGSDTSRLNRDAAARVDGEMMELLELCERVRVESEGAFDVRCGPEGSLDFGAVGKGWALDRAAEVVRGCGVSSALLHGGTSSVVGIGADADGEAWTVGVRSDGEGMRVGLRDAAMGVSSPRGYRGGPSEPSGVRRRPGPRGVQVDSTHGLPAQSSGRTRGTGKGGTGESHIVDPRTGGAAAKVDTAVVVIGGGERNACALADAWSTALVVLGGRAAGMDGAFESYVHTTDAGWISHAVRSMGAA